MGNFNPVSDRILNSNESITLKLNAKAEALRKEGKKVYNLTAGQLPYRPSSVLIEKIEQQLNLLSSYQYSPVAGKPELKEKVIKYFEESRGIEIPRDDFGVVISTGAKQSVFNLLGTIINPGDEVITLAPFWISYPEMIKYWQGTPVPVVPTAGINVPPSVEDIKNAITEKTKAIILNSPSNPTGIFYDEEWIKNFADMISEFSHVGIVSDEIYFKLNYYDPAPKYPYHFRPELLERTFLIDGISKSMACTGLRIGYTVARNDVIKGMSKLQGQSTSNANSLMQGALIEYDFSDIDSYLGPVKNHLRVNSEIIKEKMQQYGLEGAWYQTNSAFYFFLNFAKMPIINKFKKSEDDDGDYAFEICETLISETGIVAVPSSDFGIRNCARISLVLERQIFTEALDILFDFLSKE